MIVARLVLTLDEQTMRVDLGPSDEDSEKLLDAMEVAGTVSWEDVLRRILEIPLSFERFSGRPLRDEYREQVERALGAEVRVWSGERVRFSVAFPPTPETSSSGAPGSGAPSPG